MKKKKGLIKVIQMIEYRRRGGFFSNACVRLCHKQFEDVSSLLVKR